MSIYPDEAAEYVLQCRAQSSQAEAHSEDLCNGCDSFAMLECSWLICWMTSSALVVLYLLVLVSFINSFTHASCTFPAI